MNKNESNTPNKRKTREKSRENAKKAKEWIENGKWFHEYPKALKNCTLFFLYLA